VAEKQTSLRSCLASLLDYPLRQINIVWLINPNLSVTRNVFAPRDDSPAVAHDMGAAFMLYAQGLLPFLLPLSVLLFESNATSRGRMLPFLVLGGATTVYILWALTAFPLQLSVKENSIVYINQATNNAAVALLYVIATCGSLFFSKIRMMVIFGAANLLILLVVMEVKRYAFTSLWCAYAAIASVIILAYFWRSHPHRPFSYA
jgi:hypothetical protein